MRDLNNLPDLELALIQTTLVWQDADANRERFAGLLDQARGADQVRVIENGGDVVADSHYRVLLSLV